jgi:hypothetical protein
LAEERFLRQLSDMRTMIVNKEERVRSSFVTRKRYFGAYAEPLYPLV